MYKHGLLFGLVIALGGCQKAREIMPAPVPRQLTTGARFDGEPHVSPDGSSVVYSAFGAAGRDLFVAPVSGGEPRLLYAAPGNEERPRFSPDGQRVVFSSDQQGSVDIWTVSIDGSGAKPLTFEAGRDAEPDWSPEGDRIVFVSDRGGRPDLWVMTLASGAAAPLTSGEPPAPDYRIANPFWAGDRILFSATTLSLPSTTGSGSPGGSVSALYSIPAAGGRWTKLMDGPANKSHPALSKDGRLAFVSDTTYFNNIYVLEKDGRMTTVTEARTDCFDLAWMPNGRTLVYSRRSPWALLAAPAAGGHSDTLLDARGGNFDPAWSPDARELAYQSDLAGQDDVWRLEVGEDAGAAVTTNLDSDGEPDWSPVTNRICYSATKNGDSDVWIMDPSGIEFFNVTRHPARDRTPRWTPDGKEILFVSDRAGNDDLWIVAATGGEPRRLTDDPGADRYPALTSQAGSSWVVFESLRAGRGALWRMPLGGGPALQVTRPDENGWDARPAASPAEEGVVAFTRGRGDNSDLFVVNVFQPAEPRLISGDAASQEDNAAFSPDGKQVAFQSGGNFDVWVVEVPVPAAPEGKKR